MDLIELVKKLVSIPSHLGDGTNESKVADFIFEYLQQFKFLTVEKQYVDGNRYNIIAHDGYPPRLMFCSHMDTVQPPSGWHFDPYEGVISDGKLYGLGAGDMKGGLACALHALHDFETTHGIYYLFDVDEEYYFMGMRKFLESYNIAPQLAVFPEPGMRIWNGHRGLIEVAIRVRGISGHASRPTVGKNAILGLTNAVNALNRHLSTYDNPVLGSTSCNLAFIRGGLYGGEDEKGNVIIVEQANSIPDIAEATIDIRPSDATIRVQSVTDFLEAVLAEEGFQLEKVDNRIDYGSFFISPDRLTTFEDVVRDVLGEVTYEPKLDEQGFGEAQLLNEKSNAACVYFGPDNGKTGHKPDEYVVIETLFQVRQIFSRLISIYCSG